jgi:hypothetical protein
MTWKCPDGCHELKDFEVHVSTLREDTIVHYYALDDRELKESLGNKTYCGASNGAYDPVCGTCDTKVFWEGHGMGEETPSMKRARLSALAREDAPPKP